MGSLYYGEQRVFEFDDLLLTHLRTVILGKLNMHESFVFTWVDGNRQRSIWVHPGVTLQFEFEATTTPELSREWIDALTALANGPTGLRIVEEPGT